MIIKRQQKNSKFFKVSSNEIVSYLKTIYRATWQINERLDRLYNSFYLNHYKR